jgi:hypothetical protein
VLPRPAAAEAERKRRRVASRDSGMPGLFHLYQLDADQDSFRLHPTERGFLWIFGLA